MQDEKSDSDQRLLGKVIGSGTDKWDKSFIVFLLNSFLIQ